MTDFDLAPKRPAPKAFALEQLRLNPDLTFQDMKLRASMAGIAVHHVVFARARAELGIAPLVKRQRRKPVVQPVKAPVVQPVVEPVVEARRRPTNGATAATGTVSDLLAAVQAINAERQQLRALLEQIAAVIEPLRRR